ncbi:MAG: lipid-binding SYLF domain-containing protein [Rhodospirillaceae bacterium]
MMRSAMSRVLTAGLLAAGVVIAQPLITGGISVAQAQSQEESLREARAVIHSAEATVTRLLSEAGFSESLSGLIKDSRAVLVVPDFYKAGVIIGGSYGNGVLLVRGPDGFFSDPAFYRLTSGSVGLQLGMQNAETVIVIMTDEGLNAVMNDGFKGGANVNLTFGLIGAGADASTTSDVGEDLYAFSHNVGLFGGAGLEGTSIEPRDAWNYAFYGFTVTPEGILLNRETSHPDVFRLKNALAQ